LDNLYESRSIQIAFFIVINNNKVERTTTTHYLHARLSPTAATLLTTASASPGADPTYRISSVIIIRACLVSTGDFLKFFIIRANKKLKKSPVEIRHARIIIIIILLMR